MKRIVDIDNFMFKHPDRFACDVLATAIEESIPYEERPQGKWCYGEDECGQDGYLHRKRHRYERRCGKMMNEESLKKWEQKNIELLTSREMGEWLYRREMNARLQGEIKKYKPLELDYNVQCAVENLRTAYWSNEPEKVAKDFTEAEDIIISSICHHGYTVCKLPQGEWIYDEKLCNWKCSKCFETPKTIGYTGNRDFMNEHFKYCNHCGAKMVVKNAGVL